MSRAMPEEIYYGSQAVFNAWAEAEQDRAQYALGCSSEQHIREPYSWAAATGAEILGDLDRMMRQFAENSRAVFRGPIVVPMPCAYFDYECEFAEEGEDDTIPDITIERMET